MGEELIKEVKIMLRSLVVSSPTQMDSRMLMRDYHKMLGTHIPLAKLGYRDFVPFLRERCADSFLLTGPPSNPVLTVIVPDSSKHIDNFVQRSKVPSTSKVRVKRRSIPESRVNPPKQDLIYDSFIKRSPSITEERKEKEVKAPDIIRNNSSQDKENVNHHQHTTVTSNDVKNFLKKRLPLYNSLGHSDETLSDKAGVLSQDSGSIQHTSSSSSSTKALQFEELKSEIMELISAAEDGVWCTDLIRLYRERYHRELNFTRFGYTSIVSLAYAMEAHVHISRPVDTGDWLLRERARQPAAAPASPAPPAPRPRALLAGRAARRLSADPDDALPGVEFDSDVFPADCVSYLEEIPSLSLASLQDVKMLEVMIGEVYSPSHFWLIRIGENHSVAMETIMDEMTSYYDGPGRARSLARGAVRVGHCCAARYERDWHRSLIVKVLDSDTVKVRHVDYGTVETQPVSALRPLRREWAALPAQAVRARLAAVRPGAAGRRWPHAAAEHFLKLVCDKRFYAVVVATDTKQDVLETMLIDTSGPEDVNLSTVLVRAGYADPRADSALWTAESYLYPRFEALEGGDTPTFAEIRDYLRDGIALDYVEAYRLHVPVSLPPASLSPASLPPDSLPPDSLPPTSLPPPTSPDSGDEDATLHDFYVAAPPSPPRVASPDRADLPARIPLLWPASVPSPGLTSEHPPLSDSPYSSSYSRHSPSSPSAPQAHPAPKTRPAPPIPPAPVTPPVPPSPPAPPSPPPTVVKQAPETPAPVHRPSPGAVDPLLNLRFAVNPDAQPFIPRQFVNPQPLVHGACLRPPACGMFPPPPGLPPAGCWFGPYPAPGVTLSLDDCDTYRILAAVDPSRAHRFMVTALGRAMQGPPALGPPGMARVPPGPPGMARVPPGPPGMARVPPGPPGLVRAPGGVGPVRAPPGFGA